MARILPSLATLLLCSTALAGCDTLSGASSGTPASDKTALEKHVHEAPPSDVASGVRQAHDLRLAGNYDDATRILSQMMLVASDDPRVVGEYGKTLLQRGRTQDAVLFLSRAVQLDATDWTTYSALGVAYDQVSDARSAKDAYEHALALQPNEASVLSNYALSRMLASDLPAARLLAARAQKAGGDADPKIARNIAMIAATAPAQPVAMAPSPVTPTLASAAPAPAPVQKVATASEAPVHIVPASNATPTSAPRVLMPATASNTLPAGTQPYSGVVMQAVPFDPLAGPVAKPAPVKTAAAQTTKVAAVSAPVKHAVKHTPEIVAKAVTPAVEPVTMVKSDVAKTGTAKTETVKPNAEKIAASTPAKAVAATIPVKPVPNKTSEPVKAAAVATPAKAVAATTPVKPVTDKTSEPVKAVAITPPVKAAAVTTPVKAVAVATPVKPVADKTSEPVKAAAVATPAKAVAVATPVKPVSGKPAPIKVAAVAPAKGQAVTDKTPAAVKPVAAKQDGVPALRLAADGSTP